MAEHSWVNGVSLRDATVLVVDDDDSIRRALKKLLGTDGFRVVTATDGRRAIEVVAEVQPDLVLLDVMIPSLMGLRSVGNSRVIPTHC